MRPVKIIVEKHADGYVAYSLGIEGVAVGQGETYEEALNDAKSALTFHVETFGVERSPPEDAKRPCVGCAHEPAGSRRSQRAPQARPSFRKPGDGWGRAGHKPTAHADTWKGEHSMATLSVELSEDVLLAAGYSREDFLREAKFLLVAKLFELGRLSAGKAAELCAMTRVEFMFAMGRAGIPVADLDDADLEREFADV